MVLLSVTVLAMISNIIISTYYNILVLRICGGRKAGQINRNSLYGHGPHQGWGPVYCVRENHDVPCRLRPKVYTGRQRVHIGEPIALGDTHNVHTASETQMYTYWKTSSVTVMYPLVTLINYTHLCLICNSNRITANDRMMERRIDATMIVGSIMSVAVDGSMDKEIM